MKKTEEQLSVESAYARGAKIEYRNHRAPNWIDLDYPSFDWGFGDYRVKGESTISPAPKTPDEIPWSAINPRYTYSAREPNGMIFVYEGEPELVGGGWSKARPSLRIDHIMNCGAGTVTWTGSKQARKEMVWFTGSAFNASKPETEKAPVTPFIMDRGEFRVNPKAHGAEESTSAALSTALENLKSEIAEVQRNISSIRATMGRKTT